MIGIYEVTFKPLTKDKKFNRPLKKEDNRNLIKNLSKELGTNGLKYDGEKILISNRLLHKINNPCLRGARENENVYVSASNTVLLYCNTISYRRYSIGYITGHIIWHIFLAPFMYFYVFGLGNGQVHQSKEAAGLRNIPEESARTQFRESEELS